MKTQGQTKKTLILFGPKQRDILRGVNYAKVLYAHTHATTQHLLSKGRFLFILSHPWQLPLKKTVKFQEAQD